MGKLFGTDGVRGIANKELTCDLAFKLGMAGAFALIEDKKTKDRPKILIGQDSRISGGMLEAALVSGMTCVGVDAYCAGVITTPAIAYLTKKHGFSAGVMISASHNPFEYNGIKFFDGNGLKLPDATQDMIEDIILNNKTIEPKLNGEIGRRFDFTCANRDYIDFIKDSIDVRFDGLRVVLDCANGASSYVAPVIFAELGAQVIAINNKPSGININDNCGSTCPKELAKKVLEHKADIGLAFDGDSDRLICVDDLGTIIDGDKIMVICANHLKNQGKLKNNTLVATIMSNMGLFKAMEKAGINVATTGVGDRYVLEEMLKSDLIIGGEQSGHIIMLEYGTTGDGILSGAKLLSVMVDTKVKISELGEIMEIWPQVLVNAHVTSGKQKGYVNYPKIMEMIAAYDEKYAGNGRVLIRASGTEPVIRVMIEGKNQEEINTDAKAIADFIEATIK